MYRVNTIHNTGVTINIAERHEKYTLICAIAGIASIANILMVDTIEYDTLTLIIGTLVVYSIYTAIVTLAVKVINCIMLSNKINVYKDYIELESQCGMVLKISVSEFIIENDDEHISERVKHLYKVDKPALFIIKHNNKTLSIPVEASEILKLR